MSFDGAKVRRFLNIYKHFWKLCAQTALFLTQINNISINHTLASPKVLTFGKIQKHLVFRSLIRTFAAQTYYI
jgi:hypothetical protein